MQNDEFFCSQKSGVSWEKENRGAPTLARFLFLRPGASREARILDDSCGFWTLLFPDARLHNDFHGFGHDPNSRNQAYPGLCRAYVATGPIFCKQIH